MSKSLLKIQQIQAAIQQVLINEWDPIGVAEFPEAQREYDGYVAEVYQLIASKASRQEIATHLLMMETELMGLNGDRRKAEIIANRLLELIEINYEI